MPTNTAIRGFERRRHQHIEGLLLSRSPSRMRGRGKQRLLCSACAHHVTDVANRILRAGAHQHTCTNPLGLVFEIGCFATAPGCVEVGQATEDYCWFAGFAWRVATCGRCHAQLGWRFRSNGEDHFYGLILDRLLPAQ